VQGQGDIETVETGGFQANPDPRPGFLQPRDQRLMAAGAVGKTTLPVSSAFDFESDDQLSRTNIDSTTEKIFRRRLVHE